MHRPKVMDGAAVFRVSMVMICNMQSSGDGVDGVADKRDYYEVLGVGKDASEDEIKKATVSWRANIIRM